MWPYDHLWAQDRAPVGVDLLNNVFAGDLEGSIGLTVHVSHVFAGGQQAGMGLADGAIIRVAIDADGADKHITLHACTQPFGAWPHLPRRVATHVHTHVPRTARQGFQTQYPIVAVPA